MGRMQTPGFFRSPTHEEALARLHYLVDQQRLCGLLLGPAGSGKTTTLQVFAEELAGRPCQAAAVNVAGLSAREALYHLALELGTQADAEEPDLSWWRRIEDRLSSNRYQQLTTLIVWDDLDRAGADVTALLLRLLRLGRKAGAGLTLIAAAQSERLHCLDPYLFDLCDLRMELLPWDERDLAGYLSWMRRASGSRWPSFSSAALMRLRELSRGLPRQAQRLMKLAAVAAEGSSATQVDVPMLENVYCELSIAAEGALPR